MADIFNFTDTWNANQVFEAIRVNVTDSLSNAGSSLIYLDIGGVIIFRVDKSGDVVITGDIVDSSNNELISFASIAGAVNEFTVVNASTGNDPIIAVTGDDLTINLQLQGKGAAGGVILEGLKYPLVDGTVGQVIQTDGAGTLTFVTQSGGLGNVVEDTSPQYGGNMDVNGFSLVSVSTGDILITPDTTGNLVLDGLSWPQADGTVNQVIVTDGAGQLSFTSPSSVTQTPWLSDIDVAGFSLVSVSAGDIAITPDTTGNVVLDGLSWPQSDGTANQIIETDGAGQLSFVTPAAAGTQTPWLQDIDQNGFSIVDSGGLEILSFGATPSAVNEIVIGNNVTGLAPTIKAFGDDTDIDLSLAPLGTGAVLLSGLKYPIADGTANQVIETDGAGTLSFVTPTGGGGSPGGVDTEVQYNNGGAFGGMVGVNWDDVTEEISFVNPVNGVDGVGTDVAGSDLTLAGGQGRGTGVGGNVVIQVAPAGLTGSSLNSLVDVGVFTPDGLALGGVTPVASVSLLLPQENDAVTPTLAFGDGDTGLYEQADDNLAVSLGGLQKWIFSGELFRANNGGSPFLENLPSSSTNPVIGPRRTDITTGIGGASGEISLITGSTEGVKVDAVQNVKLSGSAAHATTAGSGIISLFNGTAPVGTLTDGASFYVAAGQMTVIQANGVATAVSPHDLETGEWIFYSKNTVTGRVVKVRMEELMKRLAKMVGPELFEEFYEEVT